MKKTLLLVFAACICLLTSFALLNGWYTNQLHQKQAQLLQIDRIALEVQQHKDVLIDLAKPGSYFDEMAQNELYHQKSSTAFYSHLNQSSLVVLPDSVYSNIKKVQQSEKKLLQKAAQLGFKEYGLIGNMRRVIHRIENDYPIHNAQILSLRRDEKDYLMRLDDHYALALNERMNQWLNQRTAPLDLPIYKRLFNEAHHTIQEIYFTSNAVYPKWINHIEHLQANIRSNRTHVLSESYAISKEAFMVQLSISICSIVLFFFIGFFVVRKITSQVNHVQRAMDNFIRSNYEAKQLFNKALPRNEIGLIALHFKQLAHKIHTEVQHLESRVERRTNALNEKNALLELQHKEIVQSLTYARNLQHSLLVSSQKINEQFPSSTVYYSPKDIVGGDFYWMKQFKRGKTEMVLFALADCTGHGVPGALISVMGMNILDQLYAKSITNPSQLLNELSFRIRQQFKTENGQRMDGMDIGIFLWNKTTNKITFSGAQMPLWVIQKEGLIELKGQRIPIGYFHNEHPQFENQSIQLTVGDQLLLFSDGMVDQFGELTNKKLGKKALRMYVEKGIMQQKPFHLKAFIDFFNAWKGENEQTDDCTCILLEIPVKTLEFSEFQTTTRCNRAVAAV